MLVESVSQRPIGRYLLLEQVGRGAMGIVYRAQDPLIQRTVAVKILSVLQTLSPDQAAVVRERFLREAQTAGNLDHPNVVKIFDVGLDEERGDLYLVMEFLAGPTLDARLADGPLSPDEVVLLLRPIASALDAAHARGIVHRDIKPGNILFSDDGAPKITDFGIAHVTSSHLTQDTRDLGTPVFMSPEQVQGKPLDRRADLFSLGVMTYQMLAGRPPFEGKNAVSVAYQIVHSTPPPLSRAAPHFGTAVDAVFEKILAKSPADRFDTGAEFVEALAAALHPAPAGARPRRGGNGPLRDGRGGFAIVSLGGKRAMGLAALAAAVCALALLARWWPSDEAPQRATGAESVAATAQPAATPTEPRIEGPRTDEPVAPPQETAPAPAPPAAIVPPPRPERGTAPPAAPPARRRESPREGPPATAVAGRGAEDPASSQAAPTPIVEVPADPLAQPSSPLPASQLQVSLAHWIGQGTLVVSLDGVEVFREDFRKPKLVPMKTTDWEGFAIPGGSHTLTARVTTPKGKVYDSQPFPFDLASGDRLALRIGFRDKALTIKRRGDGKEPAPEAPPPAEGEGEGENE